MSLNQRLYMYIKAYILKTFIKESPFTILSLKSPLYLHTKLVDTIVDSLFPFIKENPYSLAFGLNNLIRSISNNLIELDSILVFRSDCYKVISYSFEREINFLTDFYKYYVDPKYLFRPMLNGAESI